MLLLDHWINLKSYHTNGRQSSSLIHRVDIQCLQVRIHLVPITKRNFLELLEATLDLATSIIAGTIHHTKQTMLFALSGV